MKNSTTFAEHVLQFNSKLSKISVSLPDNFRLINPFSGAQHNEVKTATTLFYKKYYDDNALRRIIWGISPSIRGSAVTGIPFEDVKRIQIETGVNFAQYHVSPSSSDFLSEVIINCGGYETFYSKFYMTFVCPLGIARVKGDGKLVNCNYYESKHLQKALYELMVNSLLDQIHFGIDTTVSYCIGSGENYRFLSELNKHLKLFNTIVPLEHPRYIMQYNSSHKEEYMAKYLHALCEM